MIVFVFATDQVWCDFPPPPGSRLTWVAPLSWVWETSLPPVRGFANKNYAYIFYRSGNENLYALKILKKKKHYEILFLDSFQRFERHPLRDILLMLANNLPSKTKQNVCLFFFSIFLFTFNLSHFHFFIHSHSKFLSFFQYFSLSLFFSLGKQRKCVTFHLSNFHIYFPIFTTFAFTFSSFTLSCLWIWYNLMWQYMESSFISFDIIWHHLIS